MIIDLENRNGQYIEIVRGPAPIFIPTPAPSPEIDHQPRTPISPDVATTPPISSDEEEEGEQSVLLSSEVESPNGGEIESASAESSVDEEASPPPPARRRNKTEVERLEEDSWSNKNDAPLQPRRRP